MKTVLYIGNNETATNFEETAKACNVELRAFYAVSASANSIIDYALSEDFDSIILNIDEIIAAQDNLKKVIERIVDESDSKLCIMCPGYTVEDEIIQKALDEGVEFYMIYVNSSGNNKVFRSLIEGTGNVFEIFGVKTSQEEIKNKKEISSENISENTVPNTVSQTEIIAIGSCLPRMGATTVAIQVVRYLLRQGKTACYVDLTGSDYMEDFKLVYENEGKIFEEHNLFILDGIDFYYDMTSSMLTDLKALDTYDCIVVDIGTLTEESTMNYFLKNSDYRFVCCGSKPNEVKALYQIMNSLLQEKVYYMFYSVPIEQRETINNTCKHKNQICCYVPYIDDEFTLQDNTSGLFQCIFKYSDYEKI